MLGFVILNTDVLGFVCFIWIVFKHNVKVEYSKQYDELNDTRDWHGAKF